MKTTRIIYGKNVNNVKYNAVAEQARLLGLVRSETWRRFGSINGVGRNFRDIRSAWVKTRNFSPLLANPWKATLRDSLDDIKLYEAAAKEKVRKKIHARFKNNDDRKKYFGLLKYNKWPNDPLLTRWMRKEKKHGKNHTFNQIIAEHSQYTQFTGADGNTWIKIPSLVKGKPIAIPLNSNIKLKSMLRIIVDNGQIEVHYTIDNKKRADCGDRIIGVDKGYTEVLADSDGNYHGIGFGKLLTPISNARSEKNKKRNKIYAIAKKSKPAKMARIYRNNLGVKKRIKQNKQIKQQIRNHCFVAAHSIVDRAKSIIAEDLTSPITKRNNWKRFNRLMNQWTKGSITESLETVTKLRGSELHYVNAAYTSQMDSISGLLEGVRDGDKFHHANGDVSHADVNAARNIEQRFSDAEITRYMPYQKVKKILLDRLRASKEIAG